MSTRALGRTMIGLTLLGLGVASYLTIAHYSGTTTICPLHGGCETVQHLRSTRCSPGVPVALIGLIGYIHDFLVCCSSPSTETTRLIAVLLTVGGFGFSVYLTGRELFSIHAICPWCVSSAIIMTILACLAVWRFLRGEEVPLKAAPRGGSELDAAPSSPPSAAEPLAGA